MNIYNGVEIYCECNDCGAQWETKLKSQEDVCNMICPRCRCSDIITTQMSEEDIEERHWDEIDEYIHAQIDERIGG